MAEYWGVKVEDIFNSMKERFRPEGAKDVDTVFGYDIQDEGKWKLTVKNNGIVIEKTDNLSGCIATMKADGETFVGVNTGKVDATNAFMSGKVKVEGDMGAFGKTGKLFRMRGKGVKPVRGGPVGDLICKVSIETPVNLTREQIDLIKKLDDSLVGAADTHSPQHQGWLDGVKTFFDKLGL